jgi:hypothetical protein
MFENGKRKTVENETGENQRKNSLVHEICVASYFAVFLPRIC